MRSLPDSQMKKCLPLHRLHYPAPAFPSAFVPTPNCEVALLVGLALRVPRLAADPVAPVQLEVVIPVNPVQKVKVSSRVADTVIDCVVLLTTTPLSTWEE